MRAAVWYGRKDIRVVDVPDSPSPGPGEVKIKVAWVGVCGTDLHEYAAGPIFMPIEPHPLTGKSAPLIAGHEFSGVKPITETNIWKGEVISVALAVQNLFWGIVAVFAGGLADRFGNVKVIVAGPIPCALCMLLMSGVNNPWMLNTSVGLIVVAGVAGTSFGIFN